jgi:hypothetical protein
MLALNDNDSGTGLVLTAGVDGMVRLWDPRESGMKASLQIPAHAGIAMPSSLNPPPSSSSNPNYSSTARRSIESKGRGLTGNSSGRVSYTGGSGSHSSSNGGSNSGSIINSGRNSGGEDTWGKVRITAAAVACISALKPRGGGPASGG